MALIVRFDGIQGPEKHATDRGYFDALVMSLTGDIPGSVQNRQYTGFRFIFHYNSELATFLLNCTINGTRIKTANAISYFPKYWMKYSFESVWCDDFKSSENMGNREYSVTCSAGLTFSKFAVESNYQKQD